MFVCILQGSYGSWKYWKVLEFIIVGFSTTGKTWKIIAGPGKSWKCINSCNKVFFKNNFLQYYFGFLFCKGLFSFNYCAFGSPGKI